MKIRATSAALVAIFLTLTACSAGGSDYSRKGGDTIRVGVLNPQQLVPGRQSVAYEFAMAVWSPLAYLENDSTLSYVQAKSIESPDATTWTITLRKGWAFHDGTPVTAQAYVDSWNVVAYGPNAFENSGQLANIVGYSDLNPAKGKPATKTMSGLHV